MWQRLWRFLFVWTFVVLHQTLVWSVIVAREVRQSTEDDFGLLLGLAFLGTWFLLGAAMAWLIPAALTSLSAFVLRRRTPTSSGLMLHVLISVLLGAALLIVLPPLYEWLHTSGPRSDVFVSRRLLFAAFAIEGGAAMGLLSWWTERHSLASSD